MLFRSLRHLPRSTVFELNGAAAIFIYTHGDVTQIEVINPHAAFELGNLASRAFNLHQHKSTILVVQDLIGELAFSHRLRLGYYAALFGDDLLERVRQTRNFFVSRWVYDEDHFVLSFSFQNRTSSGSDE